MLTVFFNQHIVGKIEAHDRTLSFQDDKTWLNLADAFSLSPRLPMREEIFSGDEPAFFSVIYYLRDQY